MLSLFQSNMKPKLLLTYIIKPFKFYSNQGNVEGSKEADLQKIAAQEHKHFSFDTLSVATDNFHSSNMLGQRGFGPVFKGKLVDGREVAVKMLTHSSKQGQEEFIKEAKFLTRVQHRNVVNLLGYCSHGDHKLLVYEYVSNQSLDQFLFEPDRCQMLDWKTRFDIITGIAKGLLYLHEGAHSCVVHRDIKASNILLNEKWVPKIADFGMARIFPEDQTHANTRVTTTNGYMAPEYAMHGHLSVKSDVFSFGVVMLELISGQRNTLNLSPDNQNLLEWAYKLFRKGRTLEVLDPSIAATADADQVVLCVHIGLLCTQSDPSLRPSIRRVVFLLSKKPTSLEEPTRPGVPGSRYRKPRRQGVSSSNNASSGGHDHEEYTTSTMSSTDTTASARNVGSDSPD